MPTKVTSAVPDPNPSQNHDGLPHGSQTVFETAATFDPVNGLPLTTTDANGLETRIAYDPVTLRPLNTKTYYQNNQVGPTAEIVYHDETGNYWVRNRSQIDETNWAESTTYFDGLGRAYRAEQLDSEGNIFVDKEFDADGRVLRVSNPYRQNETKFWTTNVYDEASRIKEVVLPDGSTVKTDYGVSTTSGIIGVTKQVTDQAGKKRQGISDALGRMTRVIEDPAGQNLNTDYVFDTLGNLRKTIQGEQSRYFSYDSLGRLLRAKQPEQEVNTALAMPGPDAITGHNQWSVSYEYDDNGNISKTTDARGVFIQATYDNFNRLKFRDYSDATPDVDFYYDGTGLGAVPDFSKGKTTKVANGVSETRYKSFDVLGRLLTHEQRTTPEQLAGTEPAYTTAYAYNLSGALIEETYPSGRKVRNTLDRDGELALVQSRKNAIYGFVNYASAFKYNSSGAVEKMRLGNGHWETAQYNNRLQVTQIGLGTTDADQNLLKLEFGYNTSGQTDNNGSMRSQKMTVPTAGNYQGFVANQTYIYDDLNRIQSAAETVSGNQTWKQAFQYDRFGNRRFDAANTTTLGSCSQAQCNPLINTSDNRFSGGQGYGYDQDGNVTQDAAGQRFGYDAENHQKEFFAASNPGSTPDATYQYDGEGRRVKKTSSLETTIFVYNAGGTLVAEYSSALSQTQQVSYLTQDHLGSPRVITNENGAVTTRQDFSAFGDETLTVQRTEGLGYKPDSIRQDYTGYQKDDESGGLEFAQARYYNTKHGRFTSVDPLTASATIKNPQTFNRYSYVLNSPYKFTDPLGLISETTGACGGRCSNSGPGGGGMVSTYGDAFEYISGSDFNCARQQARELMADTPHVSQNSSEGPVSHSHPLDTQSSYGNEDAILTGDPWQIDEDEYSLRTTHGHFDPPYLKTDPPPLDRNPDFIAALNQIWKQSALGSSGVESSFNVNGDPSNPQIKVNPFTRQIKTQKIVIFAAGPNKTYAVVHVHPDKGGGNPSTPENNYLNNGIGDTGIADKYGIRFYILHKTGLRLYDPQTKMTTFINTLSDALKK